MAVLFSRHAVTGTGSKLVSGVKYGFEYNLHCPYGERRECGDMK
jgi:hypothetical protein